MASTPDRSTKDQRNLILRKRAMVNTEGRWRRCEPAGGKAMFATVAAANLAMRELQAFGSDVVRVYSCRHCCRYHLTSLIGGSSVNAA